MSLLVRRGFGVALLFLIATVVQAQTTVLNETFKLTVTDGEGFGQSVAVDGQMVVVGAPNSDLTTTNEGAAYVFSTATGGQLDKLVAQNTQENSQFGYSVAAAGGRALIGTPYYDDAGADAGAAYIFDLASGVQQYVMPNPETSDAGQEFGFHVALDGTTAMIGAWKGDGGAAGSDEGAAYCYDAASGTFHFKQAASDAAAYDNFGTSVDVSGTVGLVGAPFDDDKGDMSGSAYLLDLANPGTELFKLVAPDGATDDRFGTSVAIEGNLALIGAPRDDGTSTTKLGAVYGFDVTTGNQLFKLTSGEDSGEERFGTSVAIDGGLIAVGAPYDGDRSGSVYVFDTTTQSLLYRLVASDTAANDKLGSSVAICGDTIVAGAPGDLPTGSAYIFTVPVDDDPIPGDANDDGVVDEKDAEALGENWGKSNATWAMGDFNDDKKVDALDASILAANWGATGESCPVPEPTSITLLAAMGIMLLARSFHHRATAQRR